MLSKENLDDDMLNEVISNEDILSKENWDNNMLSEESSDEDMLKNNSMFGEDGSDREFVNKSLNAKKTASINREFVPYFKNITEALMFSWIKKYNICRLK
ncbi:hypothetical protein F8M41_012837 [Gigaspora margarita]|uniref:Uncharacterized protein n=1 Tax=Gigaspora margarita TaxID=4874 RepID=A0A8H3WZF7_GIGMA|nr:hypothetical protein F8M41_012837 [Gigaspora margarita]